MGYVISDRSAEGFIRVDFDGVIDLDEIMESDRRVLDMPSYSACRRLMCVLTPFVDMSSITVDGLRDVQPELEASMPKRGADAREAWVIPNPSTSPIVKVWELMPETPVFHAFRVFEHEKDAIDWLTAETVS